MYSFKRPKSGFAAEAVVLAGALIVGGVWFGFREIGHKFKDISQEKAVEKAADAAAKSKLEADQAIALRDQANLSLTDEKTKRAKVEGDAAAIGKTIQRSSTQGTVAVAQLPGSIQRDHLVQRFAEIDLASGKLYGEVTAEETRYWKQLATDALAGNAEAQATLARQQAEIEALGKQLDASRVAHADAQQRADAEQVRANVAQQEATAAAGLANTRAKEALETFEKNNALSALLDIFKLIVWAVAGLWVLGILFKSAALKMPGTGTATTTMHTIANGILSFLSPLSVMGEVRSRRETEKLIESAGSFIHDIRLEKPEIAKSVTEGLDIALTPTQQKRVREAYLAKRKDHATHQAMAKEWSPDFTHRSLS